MKAVSKVIKGVPLAALLALSGAHAHAAENFYKGKQITMIVGSGVGGGYDTYARVFARFLSNHIPGRPAIVAKNFPAAGGLAAADSLYTAPKDGLTIAALTNGVAMDPLFSDKGVHFDALKFGWLGSIGKLQNICATWHTSPIKTIQQAQQQQVVVSGAGASSNTVIVPKILNALIGTKFKVVAGYDPGSGLTLSVENGEVQGICGLAWSTIKASRPDWIRDHKLNILLQITLTKMADLPNVPSALDLVKDPAKKKTLELILMRQEMGRPFAAPPGTPPARLAILRKAFDQTVKDPKFLAAAAKAHMQIDPITGAQIEALLKKAYGAPKNIVRAAATLVEPASMRKK
ncbi:MAG TPA: tripartite tricarboxylate transporter substrate-binding protein [Beijerinckiaceae bacterium]|nr:tripartite tricarboxylate transporter substrate-binding protein [Beijerinckiaceae bacterium]